MLNKEEIQSAKEFLYNLPSKIPLKFLTDEFCKQYDTHYDNMFEYIEQLEHEKDITQRALSMQTQGWNEGAKLSAEKQKLIEKLEEDIKTTKRQYSENTLLNIRVDGKLDILEEYLQILKGENSGNRSI